MDAQIFLVLFSVFLAPSLVAGVVLLLFKKKSNGRKLPPSPQKLPLIGNMHQLGELSPEALGRLANVLGPIYLLQLGRVPTVVISSCEIAKEMIKNHDQTFSSRPAFYAEKFYTYGFHDISFAPHGEYWREAKKIVTVELLSSKKVRSFQGIRKEETELMANAISSNSASCCWRMADNAINLSKLAFAFGNNIVCRSAFGKKGYCGGKYDGSNEYLELIRETMEIVTSFNVANFFPWLSWLNKINGWDARIKKNFGALDAFYERVIDDHTDPARVGLEHDRDIVDALLETQKGSNQAIVFSREQMKAILQDIFLAGNEAIYSGIVWTMTELIRNPRVMQKAKEEIIEALRGGDSFVEEDDLSNLPYLNKVLKESFRIHPPSPLLIPRVTVEHCVVGGYDIPKDTMVIVNAQAFASDPMIWNSPDEFKPERFGDSAIDVRGVEFRSMPFGAGRRMCPGANFGIAAIELVLANLLHLFDWNLPDGMTVEDIDMSVSPGIVFSKKEHLWLVATPASA